MRGAIVADSGSDPQVAGGVSRHEQIWRHAATTIAACAWMLAGAYPGTNPDTFGHIALGREIIALGTVPQLDHWSLFEAPRPFVNYEWLSELLFAALHDGIGYDAILGLKCAVLGATVLVLAALARRMGGVRAELLTSLALIGALPAARFRLSDRPHIFGFLLASVYFLGLYRLSDGSLSRSGRRVVVTLFFLLHLIWVNSHGSHLLGLGATLAFLLLCAEARVDLAKVVALQALASCISPYGPRIVLDAVVHTLDPRFRAVVSEWLPWSAEWSSPWLLLGPLLYAALLVLRAPALLRVGTGARALLLLVTVMGLLALRSARFVADFVLFSAPLIGVGMALLLQHVRTSAFALGHSALLMGLIAYVPVACAELPPHLEIGHGASQAWLPAASGAWLRAHMKAPRLFADLGTSWYLMFAVPQGRFFVDGRVPFYGPEHVAFATLALSEMGLFENIARRERIEAVVIDHTDVRQDRLLQHLAHHPNFALATVENSFSLFVDRRIALREPAGNVEILPYEMRSDLVFAASAEQRARMAKALDRLGAHPNARAYRAWLRALLRLAPFARGPISNGLVAPTNDAERATFRKAVGELKLAVSLAKAPGMYALLGLTAAMACELPTSEKALAQAFLQAPSRLSLFALQELALRRGAHEQARQFLASQGSGAGDVWLSALRASLARPTDCVEQR